MILNEKYINECVNAGKILVIICKDAKDRKKIHEYIESFETFIPKQSFYMSKYETEILEYYKCWECKTPILITKEYYSRGFMENNKDESYWLTCSECGSDFHWEPNYDDYDRVFCITKHNAIVIGSTITDRHKRTKIVCDKDEIRRILELPTTKILEFPGPVKKRTRLSGKLIDNYILSSSS